MCILGKEKKNGKEVKEKILQILSLRVNDYKHIGIIFFFSCVFVFFLIFKTRIISEQCFFFSFPQVEVVCVTFSYIMILNYSMPRDLLVTEKEMMLKWTCNVWPCCKYIELETLFMGEISIKWVTNRETLITHCIVFYSLVNIP